MNYGDMTLAELKAMAKEKGIKGYSALKKQELADALEALTAAAKKTEEQSPKETKTNVTASAPTTAEMTSERIKASSKPKDEPKKASVKPKDEPKKASAKPKGEPKKASAKPKDESENSSAAPKDESKKASAKPKDESENLSAAPKDEPVKQTVQSTSAEKPRTSADTFKIEVKSTNSAATGNGIVPPGYESKSNTTFIRKTDNRVQYAQTQSQTNQPGNRTGNQSGSQAGNQYGNQSGSQNGNQYGNQSGSQAGNQYGNQTAKGTSRPISSAQQTSRGQTTGYPQNQQRYPESRPLNGQGRSDSRAYNRGGDNQGYTRGAEGAQQGYTRGAEGAQQGYTRGAEGGQQGYTRGAEGAQQGYTRGAEGTQQGYGRNTDAAQPAMNNQRAQVSSAVDGKIVSTAKITAEERQALDPGLSPEIENLDSGETKTGILEVVDGYGFIRCDNFLPGENDVYVSPAQIRKFNLKTGDVVTGNTKVRTAAEKFSALLYVKNINGFYPQEAVKRPKFEDLTPIFPNKRIHLETPGCAPAMRIVDLLSPIGKGQRGMIVSQPKAGKTTLLKQIASAMIRNDPSLHIIILLIDERPEEVTDMKESIQGTNVEVIYSTFDELPENHKRVSEMVIERAKRLVEHGKDVVILLDSITRLARAYNLTVTASGRTLSGGLDPAALHMPKKFFGAARCMREGGSLTILATALVETGSRMDDVVFEEFKGTGNMELVLDRNLSERRIFPAIDLPKSGTRREDLLLSPDEIEANNIIRRAFNSAKPDEAVERIINLFSRTRTNTEFIEVVKKTKLS